MVTVWNPPVGKSPSNRRHSGAEKSPAGNLPAGAGFQKTLFGGIFFFFPESFPDFLDHRFLSLVFQQQ